MASNHTEHFSLNQWQADDQVLRTDFNEDNAKIDSALRIWPPRRRKTDQAALDALAAEVAKRPPRRRWRPSARSWRPCPCLVTGPTPETGQTAV